MLCKCSVFKHVFCYWGWKKKCCFSHRFLFFTECMLTRQAKSPLFSVILLCFCSLCHMVFLSWGSKWFQMFEKHQVQCNRNFFQTQTPLRFVCDFPVFMLFFLTTPSRLMNCSLSFSNIWTPFVFLPQVSSLCTRTKQGRLNSSALLTEGERARGRQTQVKLSLMKM